MVKLDEPSSPNFLNIDQVLYKKILPSTNSNKFTMKIQHDELKKKIDVVDVYIFLIF